MMSYSSISRRALGVADIGTCPIVGSPSSDYCPFLQLSWQTNEVYVYRFTLAPAIVDTVTKALQIVEAYASSLLMNDFEDVRGIVVSQVVPTIYNVEVVITAASAGMPLVTKSADGMAAAMSDKLRAAWGNPVVTVSNGQFLQLLNKQAIPDWLASPPLWSAQLYQATSTGKTAAFAAGSGVWKGGNAAHPQARMLPLEVPPIVPPPGGGGAKPAASSTVLGVAAAAGLALYAVSRKKAKKS